MIVQGANGSYKPKYQVKDGEVLQVLRFVASSASAHSRQNSLAYIEKQGFSTNPVNSESLLRFYLNYLVEKGWLEKDPKAGGGIHFFNEDTRKISLIGYELSMAGQDYLNEQNKKVWYRAWSRQLLTNLPTIVVSVVASLAVSWAVYYFGAPKP
ncbi:hypothetical protein PhaeoP75_02830 [Phaeobacter gallaeciensis]|uniref:Uncharacterized protein n=1 Tax=Phaeobacter gallaeciensis TaxID=60890 RepID=A0AAD0EDZ0_9RHOB|nr:hypothetical protein Gal_02791 [Phaeobacter gallaeciensis DSM 26640]ATE93787.1 hypothetical protein PhaeoP11_02781 [Phaeobacter gallaeciensis]ATE96392.1 hypothetical protein PhaeoP73_01066 [Phaeobacter gallaeciensis]ATF02451.1 hypothetical protein PhaeoP75_02830 [Phaeobacter gallaeciensis]ATF06831.1 hypothetical protein PhaeoP63_02779 [Phaeobacter gallaeciensis]